jgi:nicotinamide riboside transporter PnuC
MGWILWFVGIFGLYNWFSSKKQSQSEGVWEEEKGAATVWLFIWIACLVGGVIFL